MRAALFAHLMTLALARQKAELPRRPLYLRRLKDDKPFYRTRTGVYQNVDGTYIPTETSRKVIAGEMGGYAVSSEEAPDFHAEGEDDKSFLIGGNAP